MTTRVVRSNKGGGGSFLDTHVEIRSNLPTSAQDRIRLLNANPRTRATAARRLNNGARGIIREAKRIAAVEFRIRSEGRRPRPGTPHYVESFFFQPATEATIEGMKVTIGNRHPAARIIEKGAQPHKIPSTPGTAKGRHPRGGTGYLIFPYAKDSLRYRYPGQPGSWPTEHGKATRYSKQVQHPGQEGFHIMARAVARARSRAGLDRVHIGV